MINHAIFVLTFAAVIGCGLVSGIFFAFSSFVMAALGRLPSEQGIAAMNSINVTVLNPVFFLAFLGTGVLCVALAAASYFWWDDLAGKLILAASLIYLIGCIGVTRVFNIPLNNALAAVPAGTPQATALWSRYLAEWTAWNTVRTVAPAASAVLCMTALI